MNPCQALTLAVLHTGPKSAADVVRHAEDLEFWTLSRSQVYREANYLHSIRAIDVTPVSGRASIMTLTQVGMNLYAQWGRDFHINEGARVDAQIRDSWYLRVRLAQHDGSNLREIIAQAATAHRNAARIQRSKELDGLATPASKAWASYHDAMAELVSHVGA